jgi:glycosyltransferase involved in cell wall biosynthesis
LTGIRLFSESGGDPARKNWIRSEAAWVDRRLQKLKPAAVILVHDALHFAPFLEGGSAKFALLGHIPLVRNVTDRLPGNSACESGEDLRSSSIFRQSLARSLSFANGVGVNSQEDLSYVRDEIGVKSAVFVGMGFADVRVHLGSAEPIVLFVGNATAPNMAALQWFVSEIWPNILTACPAARFRIVGHSAPAMTAATIQNIEKVGPVEDLDPEYQRAQVVVVPLVSGTGGVKIKVAEAMAHGRPLVTTSFGVDAQDPHQLDEGAVVADDANGFGEAVVSLLRDPELRKAKGAGAHKVFAEKFSYNACYRDLTRWLERVGAAS